MITETGDDNDVEAATEWQEQRCDANSVSKAVTGLRCGSTYRLLLTAANVIGESEPSKHVTTRTRGSCELIMNGSNIVEY